MKKLILLGIIALSFAVQAGNIEDAWEYYKNGNFEQAKKNFLEALKNGNTNSYFGLGALCMEENNFDMAEQMFLKAIENGDSEGYSGLGGVYTIRQEYDKAEKMYFKAIENSEDPENPPRVYYYNLGVLYYQKQDYDNSKKYIKKAADAGYEDAKDLYKEMIRLGY